MRRFSRCGPCAWWALDASACPGTGRPSARAELWAARRQGKSKRAPLRQPAGFLAPLDLAAGFLARHASLPGGWGLRRPAWRLHAPLRSARPVMRAHHQRHTSRQRRTLGQLPQRADRPRHARPAWPARAGGDRQRRRDHPHQPLVPGSLGRGHRRQQRHDLSAVQPRQRRAELRVKPHRLASRLAAGVAVAGHHLAGTRRTARAAGRGCPAGQSAALPSQQCTTLRAAPSNVCSSVSWESSRASSHSPATSAAAGSRPAAHSTTTRTPITLLPHRIAPVDRLDRSGRYLLASDRRGTVCPHLSGMRVR